MKESLDSLDSLESSIYQAFTHGLPASSQGLFHLLTTCSHTYTISISTENAFWKILLALRSMQDIFVL